MDTDRLMRASDADREDAAEMLRDAYVSGRLSLGEFDERSAAAYGARVRGELHDLTADLPRPGAGALPSDIVAGQLSARRAARGRHARKLTACALILVAGVAGRVLPGALFLVAALALIAVLVPPWPRRKAAELAAARRARISALRTAAAGRPRVRQHSPRQHG